METIFTHVKSLMEPERAFNRYAQGYVVNPWSAIKAPPRETDVEDPQLERAADTIRAVADHLDPPEPDADDRPGYHGAPEDARLGGIPDPLRTLADMLDPPEPDADDRRG